MNLTRQRTQQGAYVLFKDPAIPIDEKSPEYVGKVIISSSKKKYLINQLGSLGISETTLFPENVDIFCDGIKNSFREE